MAQGNNEKLWVYLHDSLYAATPSEDLTTMITRRMAALTNSEMTARLKAMIVTAGSSN